jgi:hypothetical protein
MRATGAAAMYLRHFRLMRTAFIDLMRRTRIAAHRIQARCRNNSRGTVLALRAWHRFTTARHGLQLRKRFPTVFAKIFIYRHNFFP